MKAMKVSLEDAKKRFPQLVKAAEEGEVVTICRDGNPVADMVRTTITSESNVGPNEKPKFGTLRGQVIEVDPNWWKPEE